MAGVHVYATSQDLTLATSAGWKTLLMYTEAAGGRSRLRSWGVYPRGTVNSDKPIQMRLIKASAAGTGGTAVTPQVTNGVAEAARGTFKDATGTFSVEPTPTGQSLDQKSAHPQGGIEYPSVDPNERMIGQNEIWLVQYQNNAGAAIVVTADLAMEQ